MAPIYWDRISLSKPSAGRCSLAATSKQIFPNVGQPHITHEKPWYNLDLPLSTVTVLSTGLRLPRNWTPTAATSSWTSYFHATDSTTLEETMDLHEILGINGSEWFLLKGAGEHSKTLQKIQAAKKIKHIPYVICYLVLTTFYQKQSIDTRIPLERNHAHQVQSLGFLSYSTSLLYHLKRELLTIRSRNSCHQSSKSLFLGSLDLSMMAVNP